MRLHIIGVELTHVAETGERTELRMIPLNLWLPSAPYGSGHMDVTFHTENGDRTERIFNLPVGRTDEYRLSGPR